jgi:hypothetical protein
VCVLGDICITPLRWVDPIGGIGPPSPSKLKVSKEERRSAAKVIKAAVFQLPLLSSTPTRKHRVVSLFFFFEKRERERERDKKNELFTHPKKKKKNVAVSK